MYWTAFCCAIVGSTLTHIFQKILQTSLLLFETSFEDDTDSDPYSGSELTVFAAMGIVMGLFGVIFIKLHSYVIALRRKYQPQWLGSNPYIIGFVTIIFFTSVKK